MTDQPAMPTSPERLAERLATDGRRTLEFFRGLTPAQWEQVIYTDGTQWSGSHILAHFVSSEAANAKVIENIITGGPGAPVEFEIDAFNEQNVAELTAYSIEELLVKFETLRQATVDLVRQMGERDLLKEGRHPFFGMAPVEDIIKLIYRHNQIHLRDIRRRFVS
jgi:hypothetical protein